MNFEFTDKVKSLQKRLHDAVVAPVLHLSLVRRAAAPVAGVATQPLVTLAAQPKATDQIAITPMLQLADPEFTAAELST